MLETITLQIINSGMPVFTYYDRLFVVNVVRMKVSFVCGLFL